MAIIKELLILALLIVTSKSILLQDNEIVEKFKENPYRLPSHVVPMHYNIKLIPHIVENNFTCNGETNIDVKVLKPTNAISLHIMMLTIDTLLTRLTRKDGNDVDTTTDYIPKQHDYDEQTQILTVRFEKLLDPGIYTLHFKFVGVIKNYTGFYKSFYVDKEGNKIWLASTHFQPVSARQAFPCWDEPAIKATFKFSIKHYPNYTALSNMPSTRSEVDEADGKIWTYFETTPIMSTNILGFVIADYDHISNLDGTIKIWGPKHLLSYATYPLDIAEKATRELEKFTNSTVRVPKMDHVVVPFYTSKATENWGMIVYKDSVFLRDKNLYPMRSNIYDTLTVTHELAHQWFGNLISPAWWDYLWLSEGISTYLKHYITDKFLKEWRLMDIFIVIDGQNMMLMDSNKFIMPININVTSHENVHKAYSANTYMKSALLLHMVAHFLTEDVFRNGLIKYIQAHEYNSVTPDDLWKALQDALDESDVPHDDFRVKEVMDTWFEQAGYPVVTINRDYTTGEIKATQRIFQLSESDTERTSSWWIPLNFATQSNLDFSSTLVTHWLKPQDESVTIEGVDINDWIIVNKQLTGYYRVNYDTNNWKRIAAFLNSDNYTKIPVLNRAQIIDDAYNMVRAEQLDLIIFLEIIHYLPREIDPAPWYRVFRIIEAFNDYLRIPEVAAIIKPYIFELISGLFEHASFDEHSNENLIIIEMKSKLYNYACMYGHPKCLAKATAKLLAYVQDPTAIKMLPDEEFIFCYGLINANESIWNQFLQTRKKTSKSHVKYLGCSKNLDIIKTHLNSTLTEGLKYPYNYLINNMLESLQNVDIAIDFYINHFDEIVTYDDNEYIFHEIILAIVNEDQIEKIKAFAQQRGININNQLTKREEKLAKIKDNFSKLILRSAFENNQLFNTMHISLNNDTAQSNITHV